MSKWLPWRYNETPSNRGVGTSNLPFEMVVGNPHYSLPAIYFVQKAMRTREPNTWYTSQAIADVTISPNSQGFAGMLAMQELLNLQANNGQSSQTTS